MIGIITYDAPHRKTQDLISHLYFRGYNELQVIVLPFVNRNNFIPIFQHRPSNVIHVSIQDICKRLYIECFTLDMSELNNHLTQNKLEHILIATGTIIAPEIVKNHKIINSHPGYLPLVKGLDALKWAVYKNLPIGVTTHFISENTDEGILIEKKLVPIYFEDTFHAVAFRQYEMEVEMLVDSIELLKKPVEFVLLDDNGYTATRRMPHHLEFKMMGIFQTLIANSPSVKEEWVK